MLHLSLSLSTVNLGVREWDMGNIQLHLCSHLAGFQWLPHHLLSLPAGKGATQTLPGTDSLSSVCGTGYLTLIHPSHSIRTDTSALHSQTALIDPLYCRFALIVLSQLCWYLFFHGFSVFAILAFFLYYFQCVSELIFSVTYSVYGNECLADTILVAGKVTMKQNGSVQLCLSIYLTETAALRLVFLSLRF